MSARRRMTSCSAWATSESAWSSANCCWAGSNSITTSPAFTDVPVSTSVISRRPPPVVGADSDTVREARNSPVAQTSSLSDPRATGAVGPRRAAIGLDLIADAAATSPPVTPSAATAHSTRFTFMYAPNAARYWPPVRFALGLPSARRSPASTPEASATCSRPRFRITTGRASNPREVCT